MGYPGGSDGKNVCLQCWRPRFDPWVRKIPWKRKWQPTPVLLPGKFHGQRSLVGYSSWGHRVGHDWATSLSFFHTHWTERLGNGQASPSAGWGIAWPKVPSKSSDICKEKRPWHSPFVPLEEQSKFRKSIKRHLYISFISLVTVPPESFAKFSIQF